MLVGCRLRSLTWFKAEDVVRLFELRASGLGSTFGSELRVRNAAQASGRE